MQLFKRFSTFILLLDLYSDLMNHFGLLRLNSVYDIDTAYF